MWTTILALEQEFNKQRIGLAKQYCIDHGLNFNIMSEADLLSIYTCLQIKAQARLKKTIEDTKEGVDKE